MPKPNKTYLGDSVYARYDGFGVILTTENGLPDDPSNTIFLDPNILEALVVFWGKETREQC